MKTPFTKEQAKEKIEEFFRDIKSKKKEDIKKLKRLASHYKIKLKDKKKKFCKYCFSPKLKVKKIKKNMNIVKCEECGRSYRWKIKTKIS